MDTPASTSIPRNCVKRFILRIDFQGPAAQKFAAIINTFGNHFDRLEQRKTSAINVHIDQGQAPRMAEETQSDYVLVSESRASSLTFSQIHNAVFLDAARYVSRETYDQTLKLLIAGCTPHADIFSARRIGMRFFNEFECRTASGISRIFKSHASTAVKNMLKTENISRAICMEEQNCGDYKCRTQYGVPNKFYPEPIRVYDIQLDIDSYTEGSCKVSDWEAMISTLNHAAYRRFIEFTNPGFVQTMRA